MKEFSLNNKTDLLLQHHKDGDWKNILKLFEDDAFYDERYLWVRPSQEDLQFISAEVGAHHIISLGCGSGLLEWLICEATGTRVIGLEVDRLWWESPYAPPTFLPLTYCDESSQKLSTESVLLFCYFNNRPAFEEYVSKYEGVCLIIIGPGRGKGSTHTDPEPFAPNLTSDWSLHSFREIGNTMDFIAIYRRL